MGNKINLKDIVKLNKLKQEMDKLILHKERIFKKIDEEMYLLSKSDKDGSSQRNLAIFIVAELIESFEESEQKEILSIFNKVFENEEEEDKKDKKDEKAKP